MSRCLKIIGLFFRTSSVLLNSFAKETYNSKEATNRSHPIHIGHNKNIRVYIYRCMYIYILYMHICVYVYIYTLYIHIHKILCTPC